VEEVTGVSVFRLEKMRGDFFIHNPQSTIHNPQSASDHGWAWTVGLAVFLGLEEGGACKPESSGLSGFSGD
jgi:hypothetical protein